jgi:hypothetical protein
MFNLIAHCFRPTAKETLPKSSLLAVTTGVPQNAQRPSGGCRFSGPVWRENSNDEVRISESMTTEPQEKWLVRHR